MRIVQILLFIVLAGTTFFVSYVGTRVTMQNKSTASGGDQFSRVLDDLQYAVTTAIPDSVGPMLKNSLHWPKVEFTHISWPPHIAWLDKPMPMPRKTHSATLGLKPPRVQRRPDIAATEKPSKRKIAVHRPAVPVVHAHPKPPPTRAPLVHPAPASAVAPESPAAPAAVSASSVASMRRMLQIASGRAADVVIANIRASDGGVIRFNDGSYLSIAPKLLPRDTAVTVSLSSPALPQTAALEPVSQAMLISFRPVLDGLTYAEAPAPEVKSGPASAGIAVDNAQRLRLGGHVATFVKRVFLADGSTADFEEVPSAIAPVMTADLATENVLTFSEHYRGTIMISLQRVKSSSLTGYTGR